MTEGETIDKIVCVGTSVMRVNNILRNVNKENRHLKIKLYVKMHVYFCMYIYTI